MVEIWKEEDKDAKMYFYYDVVLGLIYKCY